MLREAGCMASLIFKINSKYCTCVRPHDNVKRLQHLTHNFSISRPGSTWFECQLRYSSFCGRWCNIFFFSKRTCYIRRDESYAIIHTVHLRLIYEAKIQVLSVLTWKPAQPWYVKIKSLLFLKAYNRTRCTRSKASQIVAEKLKNSIKSGKSRHLIRNKWMLCRLALWTQMVEQRINSKV